MARSNFSASSVRIKVVGLGGGGSNAVTRMVRDGVAGNPWQSLKPLSGFNSEKN
jgi:cell division GTPase FtsZ